MNLEKKNSCVALIKQPGLGDLQILLSNIHHISKTINRPLTIVAQKTTGAKTVFKHDPHVDEVIDLEKKDFFDICNSNNEVGYKVLKNLIGIITEKLIDTNHQVLKLTTAFSLVMKK